MQQYTATLDTQTLLTDDIVENNRPTLPAGLHTLAEQIYQYKKGVRRMVLCTLNKRYAAQAIAKLEHQGIAYIAQSVGRNNVNIFFGREECMSVVKRIVDRPLCELTPEQDFILGTLLGYDLCMQCERYCKRVKS